MELKCLRILTLHVSSRFFRIDSMSHFVSANDGSLVVVGNVCHSFAASGIELELRSLPFVKIVLVQIC